MVRSGLITFLAVVITTRPYASAEEITFTFDAEMRINGALGDFEEGDEFTITYTFESSTPPSGTPGTGQSVSYVSAITSWEVEFPTRGYVFRGTDGRIVVQHDPPTRDRYMVYLNVPETEYVLPSGRRVSRLWIDCGDPAVRGPVDMLADDSIQTTKPDLSLAAYSAGKIYMHNEDGTNTTPAEFYVLYNTPPTANAGPGQEVQCTGDLTTVPLDGSASFDPDGDVLGYEWSLPEGSAATLDDPFCATPTGQLPLGPTLVTLAVTDGNGGVDCDDVLIVVVDNIPPVLVATTDKIALWPPNHEIHEVLVSVEITDCAWDTSATVPAFLSSSEPDDGRGDGSYIGDVNGQDGFALPVLMDLIYTGEPEPGVYLYEGLAYLRAERDGSERSRVYSIVCDVADFAGNTSTASCVVVVPHDRRK